MLPEGYVYKDLGDLDVRNFLPLTPELKECLIELSAFGALPYSTVLLLEQFETLVEAETELNQRKLALFWRKMKRTSPSLLRLWRWKSFLVTTNLPLLRPMSNS